ncbi:DUF5362 family protein [Dysgonomonas sp. 25]|uniref:DUF5362 family protein n=1 Tax=Dysgonomonas sp. 25 TaxID=2302933 RepID=UPI0013D78623|nr:DUF5362 family protein [Dysgonomonas sp. 25]NDV70228.1 hypothetical protein [Dysgonomonas sp. 25]
MFNETPPPYYAPQELIVTPEAKKFLNSAANWARFLGILAFSAVFIVAIGAYIISLIVSNMGKAVQNDALSEVFMMTTVMTIISVVMTVIYFYALYKILKFTSTVKRAIRHDNPDTLTEAFGHLKAHYKSMGIMMLVGIVLYVIYAIIMSVFLLYGMAVFVDSF